MLNVMGGHSRCAFALDVGHQIVNIVMCID